MIEETSLSIHFEEGKVYFSELVKTASGIVTKRNLDRHGQKKMFERRVRVDVVTAYHRPQL